MNRLFFDIETAPVEKEKHPLLREIYDKLIADGKSLGSFEEYLSYTSLDGAFGRIITLGWAINDKKVESISGPEKKILEKFWNLAADTELFIGFNILDFDLRFIYQRSIINNIKPSRDIPLSYYRNNPVFDVMWEWCKWKKPLIKLDTLAKALGLESSKDGEVEGKNVAKAFEDGKIEEIRKYCEKDVELTRRIYNRIAFLK
ncbi:MAG: ribonuclease H-like domain-containing protein [Candidatus Levybacteria bacterium]|nr:ribonuclease H-like domain-containing protein [Candidatus Levybacteria bacterium]